MTSDLWDGTPSPNVGSDNIFTNFQNPRPSATWFNYADWIIANYAGAGGPDNVFRVYNHQDNTSGLMFNLSSIPHNVNYTLTVPDLSSTGGTDQIITEFATQDLVNKSLFRSHGTFTANGNYTIPVPTSGCPTTVLDKNYCIVNAVTSGDFNGVVLPAIVHPGQLCVVLNTASNVITLVINAGQTLVNSDTNFTNPPLALLPRRSITLIAGDATTWYALGNFLASCNDVDVPEFLGAKLPVIGDVLTFAGDSRGVGASSVWRPLSYGAAIRLPTRNHLWIDTITNFNFIFACTFFSAPSTSSPVVVQLPDTAGDSNFGPQAIRLVGEGNVQTLYRKSLDGSCVVHAPSVQGTLAVPQGGTGLATLGSPGQVLTVDTGGTTLAYKTPPAPLPMFGTRHLGLSFELSANPTVNATLNAINQYTVVTGGADNAIHLPTATAGDFVVLINNSGIGGVLIMPAVGGGTNGTPLGDQGILLLMSIDGTNWRLMDGT